MNKMSYIFTEADKLRNQGQSLQAAKAYKAISESSIEPQIIGAALHMSATCLNQAGQHKSAEEYFEKAKEHYSKTGDKLNLARVERDFGSCKLAQEKLDEARDSLEKSVAGLEELGQYGELAMSQSKLASVLAKFGEQDGAESLAYKAIQNANKSTNTFYIATAYQEAARGYFLSKKYQNMPDCIYGALGALELEDDPHAKRRAELFLSLSFSYKQLGNNELAEKADQKAEECFQELDEGTANRIRGFFNKG